MRQSGRIERITKITRSPAQNKKYRATVFDGQRTRSIDFGDLRYQHFRDRIGLFSRLDHRDSARRRLYFLRHSGESTRKKALEKEKLASKGKLNARILSHTYLW